MSNGSRASFNNTNDMGVRWGNSSRLDPPYFRGPRFDYEEDERRCWCKPPQRAPMWFSWTDTNPGRRFFNCPNESKNEKCMYFEWLDEPFSPRSIEIIKGLRREKAIYRYEIRRLMNDGCDHCQARIAAQSEEINTLKSSLIQLDYRYAQQK